jgi:hypothetical protein
VNDYIPASVPDANFKIAQLVAIKDILRKGVTIESMNFDQENGNVYFAVKGINYMLTPAGNLYMHSEWSWQAGRTEIKNFYFG